MKNHIQKHHKKYSSLLVIAVTVGMSWGSSYAIPSTFLPNTHIGQVSVGGHNIESAQEKLSEAILEYKSQKLTLSVIGKNYTFGLDELGVDFDVKSSAEQVATVEGGSFWSRVKQVWDAVQNPTKYKVVVDVDREQMREAIVKKVPELEDPELAQIRFFNDALNEELDAKIGLPADYKQVEKDLIETVQHFRNSPIEVQVLARESAEDGAIEVAMTDEERTKLEAAEVDLKAASLTLVANYPDQDPREFTILFAEHPDWIKRRLSLGGWHVTLHKERLEKYLFDVLALEVDRDPEDANLKALPVEGESRAQVEGIARKGYELDIEAAVEDILDRVELGGLDEPLELPINVFDGFILNDSGEDLGDLELISVGRSNFAGSPDGRDFNVRKGLNDHYNNVLLAPGEKFSYNALLGGPVTFSNGWKGSLAIFGGGSSLRSVPGGGLCQVSTTIYRAAVNAGLKVTQRRAHSLYVHYYVPHGEGIDATIYPGSQDLVFENDTENYILMQAYAEGDDAFVNFYGTEDGRSVELDGPYRYNEVPDSVIDEQMGRAFRLNDIVWFQTITYGDGRVEKNQIVSRYKKNIPRKAQ